MKLEAHTRKKHPGFTLVELIVVIAIIAILVALLTAGIFGFIGMGNEVKNQSEINQLSIAVQNFKNKYGVYPPDYIVLASTQAAIMTADPSGNSLAYITRIWPRIDWTGASGVIDWSGQGLAGFFLQGDQCLVFFLGGIPISPMAGKGCQGFATNPKNPTTGPEFYPPLFDFDNGRLFQRVPGNPFYSFMDTYGNPVYPLDPADPSRPFLYFSSGNRHNGYRAGGYNVLGVYPYKKPNLPITSTAYMNPDTFQIISAGRDKAFGAPIPTPFAPLYPYSWTPGMGAWAATGYPPGNNAWPGYDDMANFTSNKLGIGP